MCADRRSDVSTVYRVGGRGLNILSMFRPPLDGSRSMYEADLWGRDRLYRKAGRFVPVKCIVDMPSDAW